MFSVLQIQLVICGTSASQNFTEDLSKWLFFPNIVKLLPPENKVPKQMPVRNNTENRLCGAWKILLTYFKKLSFMLNLAKHRIQYSILLNIKYIRNLKHTSYHNVLHVKKK